MASKGKAYCTSPLCSRDGKGPNACHDIQHHLTGPEAVYQPLVLSLQARVPVHLLHTNHFHAMPSIAAHRSWPRAYCGKASEELYTHRHSVTICTGTSSLNFCYKAGKHACTAMHSARHNDNGQITGRTSTTSLTGQKKET